jgi:RNA polymerase sigma factor (sigma-70 family)
MPTNRLRKALHRVQQALAAPGTDALPDAQLLARFVAGREEAAFAALVRRHGPMVLGVCRRLLRHAHDADDAFQATFLVLARKAASVVKRAAVGSWLYAVAYRTARKLRAVRARRQSWEKQVDALPHPEIAHSEPQDWRPLLDGELSRLPEKFREPVVLCDLEGRTRKQAARLLGVPDGTLSSRLVTGRKLLAERLARRGVGLSAGALAAVLSEGAAAAPVAAPLVAATAQAAVWVAGGQLAAVAPAVALLTKGVLRAMFLTKLKVVAGVVVLVAALGAGGLAFRAGSVGATQPDKPSTGKPRNELEALRRENELLKLNLEVVLEKVRSQEAELRALRGRVDRLGVRTYLNLRYPSGQNVAPKAPTPEQHAEGALKALREAKDDAARQRAIDELEGALKSLRKQGPKGAADKHNPPPNQIQGKVLRVEPRDPSLVQISVGRDAGLKDDSMLEVFRLKPNPQYLGRLRIIEAHSHTSLGRMLTRPGPAVKIEVGDQVASSIH